jgi:gliding motility-associated-like protein
MRVKLKRTLNVITIIILGLMCFAVDAGNGMVEKSKLKTDFAAESINSQLFEENLGQIKSYDGAVNSTVKFQANLGNLDMFLTENGIIYQFKKIKGSISNTNFEKTEFLNSKFNLDTIEKQEIETYRMDLILEGSNKNALIIKEGKSEAYTYYYDCGITDRVYSYSKIRYLDIYPGIDWVIYQNSEQIKYDFIVKPGVNPNVIKLKFMYHEDIKILEDGTLIISNRFGEIAEQKPVSYQQGAEISTSFSLTENLVTFYISDYDKSKELIIDPILIWATYYGGENMTFAHDIATDNIGMVYLSGSTNCKTNIAEGGYFGTYSSENRGYLVKFNSNGLRLWSLYYMGDGLACVVDSSGHVLMGGSTISQEFISFNGHQNNLNTENGNNNPDAFLVKFDSSGQRIWGTYYGGNGGDWISSIVTDRLNNIYVTGTTYSRNSISYNGHQMEFDGLNDAFVVKFDKNGQRIWGTYYGGLYHDSGSDLVIDNDGNIYIVGNTDSPNKIAHKGLYNSYIGGTINGFIAKFNNNGILLWGTYFGADGIDGLYAIALDDVSFFYVTGLTNKNIQGFTGNISNGAIRSSYLAKLSVDCKLQWGVYIGGEGYTFPSSLTTDRDKNIYLYGYTNSKNGISYSGFQNKFSDSEASVNYYISKFNEKGLKVWSTYYAGIKQGLGGGYFAICTDIHDDIYICGFTDLTDNVSKDGHQNDFMGKYCGFLAKINPCNSYYKEDSIFACEQYIWPVNGETYIENGTYEYIFIKPDGCDSILAIHLSIDTFPLHYNVVSSPQSGCVPLKVNFELSLDRKDEFTWVLNSGNKDSVLGTPNEKVLQYEYNKAGIYSPFYKIITRGGCEITIEGDTIEAFPVPNALFTFMPEDLLLPIDSAYVQFVNQSRGGIEFHWKIMPILDSIIFEPVVIFENKGKYKVWLKAVNEHECADTFEKNINVQFISHFYMPNAFSPNGDGLNDLFRPVITDYLEMNFKIYNRWGELIYESFDDRGWDGQYKGKPVEKGTYMYFIYMKDTNGTPLYFKGTFFLNR